jgi:hypothetical protein
MFQGDPSFGGSAILSDISLFVGFLTIILYFAQDKNLEIPILDAIQTIFCWPSFLEGALITGCLWAFRHIERMLGPRGFVAYLLYNALTYAPPFVVVLRLKGFRAHYSLLNFIPHSLYVFMFWRLPAVVFAEPLTDKFVISLSMFLVFSGKFPYSVLTLGAAITGYYLWTYDVLKLKRIITFPRPPIADAEHPQQQQQQQFVWPAADAQEETDVDAEALQAVMDMGFGEIDARAAIRESNGDVQQAIESLLQHI